MKKLKNNSVGALTLQIILSIALIFASAIPLAADSVQNAPAGTEQERSLTAPAGLKPVEQEAWLMAGRQGTSGGNGLASLYPKRYGEPFVVEGEGMGGSWVSTGSLGIARYLHTATLLPSGQVLVAG